MARWLWVAVAMVGCGPATGPGTNPGTTPTGTRPVGGLADTLAAVVAADARVESCSDLLIAASDPDDTALVYLAVEGGLAEQARIAVKPIETTFQLPHPDVRLVAVWGAHLRDWYGCNDVIYQEPVIDGEAIAMGGTVTITVETSKGASKFQPYAMADAVLTDVEFETEDGTTEVLDDVSWLDQFIGWYPG